MCVTYMRVCTYGHVCICAYAGMHLENALNLVAVYFFSFFLCT